MSQWTSNRATHTPVIPGRKRARPLDFWKGVAVGVVCGGFFLALAAWGGYQVFKAVIEG